MPTFTPISQSCGREGRETTRDGRGLGCPFPGNEDVSADIGTVLGDFLFGFRPSYPANLSSPNAFPLSGGATKHRLGTARGRLCRDTKGILHELSLIYAFMHQRDALKEGASEKLFVCSRPSSVDVAMSSALGRHKTWAE